MKRYILALIILLLAAGVHAQPTTGSAGPPVVSGTSSGVATDVQCGSACVDFSSETNATCGSGVSCSDDDIATASTEPAFLNDGGTTSLACGASNQGKMQVLDNGTLEYCDGATTSVLRSITEGAGGDVTSVLGDTTGAVPILFQNCTAFTGGDSTPDVSAGNTFCTANVVTITDFDDGTDHTTFDSTTTNRWLDILFLHAATLDCSSSQIYCNAGADWTATVGDFAHCIYDDTVDTDTLADGTWLCAVSNPTHFTSATIVCDPATQVCINSADEETVSPLEGAAGDCNWGFVNNHLEYFCNGEALSTVVADTDTVTKSIYWSAGAMSSDGTNCADPAEVTINSGPKQYSIICTDNDGSRMHGMVVMPDGWNAGTLTFEVSYVQTAADTAVLNMDVAAACRDAGTAINSTYGTEVAIDDAAVSGSNIIDQTTSGAVTANGTCAAGDLLYWYLDIDATGTTTAMATLNILGVKMEYTWNYTGD